MATAQPKASDLIKASEGTPFISVEVSSFIFS